MTEVIVALIAAAAVVLGATIPVIVTTRRTRQRADAAVDTAQETQDRIGTPNGKGNVVQMLERLLTTQTELLGTTAELLGGQAAQDSRLARLETGQTRTVEVARRVEIRLGQLEAGSVTTKPKPSQETPPNESSN